jgi:hypothetical protein
VWNSEHGKNVNGHKGLDWFGPPESETLRLVWGGIMCGGEVPSNGVLRRLIWSTSYGFHSRSVDPHRGRLQNRKAIALITGSIS